MNKLTRPAVIAGNWKMNMTPAQTTALLEELKPLVEGKDGCTVVVCVPYVDILPAVNACKGTAIHVGAQNVHYEEKGAYTGEISPSMLTELGCEYVVIGHSERRQYFGETDVTVNKRLTAALRAGLTPILCVGELLEERDQDITFEVVARQLKIALLGVSPEDARKVIIAYEPVWAIGTGRTATAEQAEEVCEQIRATLSDKYGIEVAEAITVQYGGSMKASNAAELLSKHNVDGGLIGGASLIAKEFAAIVDAAQ